MPSLEIFEGKSEMVFKQGAGISNRKITPIEFNYTDYGFQGLPLFLGRVFIWPFVVVEKQNAYTEEQCQVMWDSLHLHLMKAMDLLVMRC